jgi:dihydropyrimidine dehydrogenase (NAD+) subunit PreA
VAVIGGGAVAADCALTAARRGAAWVELLALESLPELPLTSFERAALLEAGVHITGRTRVTAIPCEGDRITGVDTVRVELPPGIDFDPGAVIDVTGTDQHRPDLDAVVVAIGATPSGEQPAGDRIIAAGDVINGPTTVVEAVAAGKNAAEQVLAVFDGGEAPIFDRPTKGRSVLAGRKLEPVPLDCELFGFPIRSPLLLSAAPSTDGYEQMRLAYEAGWPGGVMKTAFDGVPIHIPAEYMVTFSRSTYGNCDNVSGHPLDRVCGEIERLRREFPDRLTMASTGGPVTGNDGTDSAVWQSNTRKLQDAGAAGIEYSLSCPQGGDGTKGDIVSQDPELTATVVGWVMAASDPAVPKLFKLTAAVTAIVPVVAAVREVLDEFPDHPAGITLANTFPSLDFRPRLGASSNEASWYEGVVVGMSGAGVLPITALAIAKAAPVGVPISANGGVMDAHDAAHLLALGATTVQLCTAPLRYGLGVVGDLHSGLSHILEARGLASVSGLVGLAMPDPITEFEQLSAVKGISAVDTELCIHCGNCTHCPYLAISLDHDTVPVTDPARCIGCSLCALRCPSGALGMRPRTDEEAAALVEE